MDETKENTNENATNEVNHSERDKETKIKETQDAAGDEKDLSKENQKQNEETDNSGDGRNVENDEKEPTSWKWFRYKPDKGKIDVNVNKAEQNKNKYAVVKKTRSETSEKDREKVSS